MKEQQAWLLLYFIGLGAAAGLIYDLLRAFRREIPHAAVIVILEDSLFGSLVCIGCYALFFWKNQGALRIYGFLGFAFGALLYIRWISPWMLRLYQGILKGLLFPIRWLAAKQRLASKRKKKKKSVDESKQME